MNSSKRDDLHDIAERIARAKSTAQAKEHHLEDHHSQVQHGWRMVTELVVGPIIGFGIGYGLDALFKTIPAFIIAFTLLGFFAGVRVMLKTASEMQKQGQTGLQKQGQTGLQKQSQTGQEEQGQTGLQKQSQTAKKEEATNGE